jgi:hypothetical protein
MLRPPELDPTGAGSTLADMSEKRHRQQQRRLRRKSKGRSRPKAAGGERRSAVDRESARLFAEIAEIASRDAREPADALDAELWASHMVGICYRQTVPGEDVVGFYVAGVVEALEDLETAAGLATLRALSAVGGPEQQRVAHAAADRLAGRGLPEPGWVRDLGKVEPTAAALMYDEVFDDGVTVLVEFSGPGAEPHTVGIYVDHNLGGLVKDSFLVGLLADIRAELSRCPPDDVALAVRDLEFAEARARVEAALYMLDHTLDPPVDDDVYSLRALMEARVRLLPEGFALADDYVEYAPTERDALLTDFFASPEGRRWRDDEHAQEIAELAIDFGAGYNHGGPLRWSPVVVEIFMTSWLARKAALPYESFARVPDVLRDWVRYAGRRRSVPAAPLKEAVAAVGLYTEEMLETVDDPDAWGPAKMFAMAAREAGVDLTEGEQLERFVQQYNDGLAA